MTPRGRRSPPTVGLSLATATENGAASSDSNHRKRPSTREARLAGTSVDHQLFLLAADLAPCLAIGVDTAAAIGDRGLEGLAQLFMQPLLRPAAHPPGHA